MYRREGPTCMGRLLFLIVGALGILIILWAMGVIDPLAGMFGQPGATVNAPGPAIVQQLRARNEWVTFSYQADQLIEASREGNFLQNLLFGDRILLQARGEVAGGVDMSQLKDSDIVINGTSITMNLPPARVIYTRLDNDQTRIYDRTRGWLSKGDVNLESSARVYAEQSILQSACDAGILDRAATTAKTNVSDLLQAAGFTDITVTVSKVGDCAGSANGVINQPQAQFTPEPTAVAPVPVATPSGGASVPVVDATPTTSGGLSGTAVPVSP